MEDSHRINSWIKQKNLLIGVLAERCVPHAVMAESLVRIKKAWNDLPEEKKKEWLTACDDSALAEIARQANQFFITRYGEALRVSPYRALEQYAKLPRQVLDYRNAFNHPEAFEPPKLEWDAIIQIRENIIKLVDTLLSSERRTFIKRPVLEKFKTILNQAMVYDPAVFTPENFGAAVNAALQFNEMRVGAHLSAIDKIYAGMNVGPFMAPDDTIQIPSLEISRDHIKDYSKKRSRLAHQHSGRVPTDSLTERSKESVISALENVLKARGRPLPDVENPVAEWAQSLNAPVQGGGKPTSPPPDDSVMERYPHHWQERVSKKRDLSNLPFL